MGYPKALLRIDGTTFVSRVVQTLKAGGCDPVFVVVPEGDETIRVVVERMGATVLINPDPGEGPVTSLRLALEELDTGVDAIAYLPVDHPVVRPATVAALIQAAEGQDLVVPVHLGKRGHPALLGRRLFPELADPLLEGGARTVVHRHLEGAKLLEVEDPGVTTDVDTPEELQTLLSKGGRSR